MKQYTTREQTAKLIELGFEKPKGLADAEPSSGKWVREAYSIGELIGMMPKKLDTATGDTAYLEISWDNIGWRVDYVYFGFFLYTSMAIELIDALYDMVVTMKAGGVI